MLWKCCIQYASKFENSSVATGLEKVSFHSLPVSWEIYMWVKKEDLEPYMEQLIGSK